MRPALNTVTEAVVVRGVADGVFFFNRLVEAFRLESGGLFPTTTQLMDAYKTVRLVAQGNGWIETSATTTSWAVLKPGSRCLVGGVGGYGNFPYFNDVSFVSEHGSHAAIENIVCRVSA